MKPSYSNRTLFSVLWIAGATFILAGISLSEPRLLVFLRGPLAPMSPDLHAGATIFRCGLVALGAVMIASPRFAVWFPEPGRPGPAGASGFNFAVAGIVVVALVLRCYGLSEGLWYDEIRTYLKYAGKPAGVIVTTYDAQNQHFLYSLLAHFSFLLWGESVWALRLPAVLFGTGSIFALYLFGRLVTSARESLFASALLAVSYHHIWFSQNARGYIGLLFWTILCSYLFLRGLREGKNRLWLMYAVTSALGVYTHLTMIFIVCGHLIIYGLARRDVPNKWSGLFLGFGIGGLLTVQLYALVLVRVFLQYLGVPIQQTEAVPVFGGGGLRSVWEFRTPEWRDPRWALRELGDHLETQFAGSALLGIAVLLIFGAGLWSFARRQRVVVYLLSFPVGLCLATVLAREYFLWPRLLLFTMGFCALILMRGAFALDKKLTDLVLLCFRPAQRLRFRPAPGFVLGCGLILASTVTIPAVYGPKQDFEGALRFVEHSRSPEDVVVTVGVTSEFYRDFYGVDWGVVKTTRKLDWIMRNARRTWLIYTFPPQMWSKKALMEKIERDFTVVGRFCGTLRGGTVYVCRYDNQRGDNPGEDR